MHANIIAIYRYLTLTARAKVEVIHRLGALGE
jgi:hypothetical protein